MEVETCLPTISFDRALGHLVSYIGIDRASIAAHYDIIATDESVSLSEVHIHFSALSVEDDDHYTLGSTALEGTKYEAQNVTPELIPPTEVPTIVIYLGSIIRSSKEKHFGRELSEALTHELGHIILGDGNNEDHIDYEDRIEEQEAKKVESRKLDGIQIELRRKKKDLDILTVNDERWLSRAKSARHHKTLAMTPPEK